MVMSYYYVQSYYVLQKQIYFLNFHKIFGICYTLEYGTNIWDIYVYFDNYVLTQKYNYCKLCYIY